MYRFSIEQLTDNGPRLLATTLTDFAGIESVRNRWRPLLHAARANGLTVRFTVA